MALESSTFISGLVASNPTSSDNISDGDNHIRLLKSTVKATFPNVTGAVTGTHTAINSAVTAANDATNANTASKIVKRDGSGNFTAGTITAALSGNATTATTATRVTATANNSNNENIFITLVDAATGSQGIETDTGLKYNPSTNLITTGAITLSGALTASSLNIGGSVDVDGTMEADAYTVDGTSLQVFVEDTVGGMLTGNTETGIAVTYRTGDNTIDFAVGSVTNSMITDGTIENPKLENSSITVTEGSSTTNISLGGTLTFSAGEGINVAEAGGTITYSAENATASNKGVASFSSTDFTVSAGAVSINDEAIEDIVGAMVTTNNSETGGIAVTYQDSDGTLDFALSNVDAASVDGKSIAVVSSLPGSPNANTIYFVTS